MDKTVSIETSFFPDLVENFGPILQYCSSFCFQNDKSPRLLRKEKNKKIKLIHKKISTSV